jgi:folate-dependent phosphoribosylglycinamide formyltransferase PurN
MGLRVLIVSSRVTFVPENYNQLVCGLAQSPLVVGCLIIDNHEWSIVAQGLALLLTGAAPRLGCQLLVNFFKDLLAHKKSAYEKNQRIFCLVKDLNSEETLAILRRENIDLILNARTRTIFKKPLLETPRLGCLNIHHGLLPDQRGLMCDFWAHLEKTPSGFSIHQMTPKLDAGVILKVEEVSTEKNNYLASIHQGAKQEVQAVLEVLAAIADQNQIQGQENLKTARTLYRKNPTLGDFFKLKFKGIKI